MIKNKQWLVCMVLSFVSLTMGYLIPSYAAHLKLKAWDSYLSDQRRIVAPVLSQDSDGYHIFDMQSGRYLRKGTYRFSSGIYTAEDGVEKLSGTVLFNLKKQPVFVLTAVIVIIVAIYAWHPQKTKPNKQKYHLVFILIAFGVVIPGILFAHALSQIKKDTHRYICRNNMVQISKAKDLALLTTNAPEGEPLPPEAISRELRQGLKGIVCPAGGRYTINPIGQPPACSVHGELPPP